MSFEPTLCVEQKLVALERLLEGRAHERISRSGILEHLEVSVEEGEVDDERPDDQANDSVGEMLVDVFLPSAMILTMTHDWMTPFDIQNAPQIPHDRRTDAHKGEQADHLAAKSAGQRSARSEQP